MPELPCVSDDAEQWFSEDDEVLEQAATQCFEGCSERRRMACLELSMLHPPAEHGVFGGWLPHERRALLIRRTPA